ncbi:T-complex protein 1 subunit eta-like protein [Perkinsela sp. CCAP 1560/4]|nr:T-complex protein 1 subunit eta-like protein [Perkinsela sp. CCAP 1560/4]|eukprot:KNH06388.1 T-complex protein 1 subunit eta-like protein [Perkinsela sp. CCAP 1560/4]
MQPQVIVLRDGTDTSQGKPQVIANINACMGIVDIVRTTLGPCGMDKLIRNANSPPCVTNDGATVLALLEIAHPAAKCMAEIAQSQDIEAGDGTTTTVVLGGEILQEAKFLIEEGYHPRTIIQGLQLACSRATEFIQSVAVLPSSAENEQARYERLIKCASTSLNSKLISSEKAFFAQMAVDAVLSTGSGGSLSLVGVKKVPGGGMRDSFLVKGVAFQKTFSYAGFEQQPKRIESPRILLLNVELEMKSEADNGEVRLKNPAQFQSIVDAEWKIIMDKLEKCVALGANVILSQKPIGDLATQFFADRGVFCAGRVASSDCERIAFATGARLQHTVNSLSSEVHGRSELFEERQVGAERFNIFSGCEEAKTVTIVLRGGAPQFIDEAERSLHDALVIVQRAGENAAILAGAGAIDMEIAKDQRKYAQSIDGKLHFVIESFARALEVIPRTLAENAGHDAAAIMNLMRHTHYHSTEGQYDGVDTLTGGIINALDAYIWEPEVVKSGALRAATEAACVILSIDETIKVPEVEMPANAPTPQGGAGGRSEISKHGMGGMFKNMPGTTTLKGRGGK